MTFDYYVPKIFLQPVNLFSIISNTGHLSDIENLLHRCQQPCITFNAKKAYANLAFAEQIVLVLVQKPVDIDTFGILLVLVNRIEATVSLVEPNFHAGQFILRKSQQVIQHYRQRHLPFTESVHSHGEALTFHFPQPFMRIYQSSPLAFMGIPDFCRLSASPFHAHTLPLSKRSA